MALDGYDINAATCRSILGAVEAENEQLTGQRAKLSSAVDEAIVASAGGPVAGALITLWNDVLAIQCEAAATRIENATGGVREAVAAYELGDARMAQNGRNQMSQAPAIVLEDAKK